MANEKESKRFQDSFWVKYIVPVILVVLSVGLLATLVIVLLSILK